MVKMLWLLLVAAIVTASDPAAAEAERHDVANGNRMKETYHNGIYVYTSHRTKRDTSQTTSSAAKPRASIENENKCYQFTWISAEENGTAPDCFKITKEGSPCFEPLVITEDGSMPDMSQIDDALTAAGVKYTCDRQKNLCMSFTYYQNNDIPFNASWFCGNVNKKDGTPGTYGVYTEILSGSQRRTLRYCDGPMCNATGPQLPSLLAVIGSLMFLWVR